MKKIILFSFLFILLVNTYSNATYLMIPHWNDADTTEVNANTTSAENFLNIESESAILIEQSTRKSSL